MAVMQLYSVLDKKVGAYMPIFTMRSRGEAMRSFMDAVDSDTNGFRRHAEDYVLMQVGAFNDQTGEVLGDPAGPVAVMSALDAVRSVDAGREAPFKA